MGTEIDQEEFDQRDYHLRMSSGCTQSTGLPLHTWPVAS
jgi:hypothetical protein